jgi:hypothetical protein
MRLASILDQYHDALQAKYGSRLLPGHLRAIEAIRATASFAKATETQNIEKAKTARPWLSTALTCWALLFPYV